MAKYFIDCEFIEDFHKPLFGKRRHYIDLISIAIVCDDGREYYAVSNDFDLSHVWFKYEMKQISGDARNTFPKGVKEYWLRDNVLKPIHDDLYERQGSYAKTYHSALSGFNIKGMKNLLGWYGKSNKRIAFDILQFVYDPSGLAWKEWLGSTDEYYQALLDGRGDGDNPVFYGYYSDYDWVLLCTLFGRMIDLPKGFPMLCYDLKQEIDRVAMKWQRGGTPQQNREYDEECAKLGGRYTIAFNNNFNDMVKLIKSHKQYPVQTNNHNALDDARWNKKLYEFINLWL